MGFPGPGIEDPMSENPFFEFVGASSYSHSDQRKRASAEFESFSRIHGKKYKDDVELTHRMAIFNHNLRCVPIYVIDTIVNSKTTIGCNFVIEGE